MANKKKKQTPAQRKRPSQTAVKTIIKLPDHPSDGVPLVDKAEWYKALHRKDVKTLYEAITTFLSFFETNHYKGFSHEDLKQFDAFVLMLANTFADESIKFTRDQSITLVMLGHVLCGITSISSFGTTDPILRCVLKQNDNLHKILMTLNARTEVQVPQKNLFDLEPYATSLWYQTYMLTLSQPTQRQQFHQYCHVRDIDERWSPPNHFVSSVYFTSTYFAPDQARKAKGVLNRSMKKLIDKHSIIKVTNNPDPKSIAIVTSKWHRNHAVYKSAGPLVEQLIGHYKLTLIHTGKEVPNTLVRNGFDNIYQAYFDDRTGTLNLPECLTKNDFQMIYYPDIGMTNESVWFSNARMAPIQAMGYGHPDTSGDDSEIDYFIGGIVEEDATDFYAETMVLIPGLGQEPAWPTYEKKGNWEPPTDKLRINCVWGPDKYNFNLLRLLQEINNRCDGGKGHEYHFFMSPGANRYGSLCAFMTDVSKLMQNVVFHTEQEYYDYMENAEQHDFSLNSFPFGGYNTIVESLYLGLPVITMEGNRFYNRAASYLLRQIDMPELTSPTAEGFVKLACDFIKDRDLLMAYRQKLAEMDLKAKLFTQTGTYFLDAVNHIIQNHPFTETVRIGC